MKIAATTSVASFPCGAGCIRRLGLACSKMCSLVVARVLCCCNGSSGLRRNVRHNERIPYSFRCRWSRDFGLGCSVLIARYGRIANAECLVFV